MTAIDKWFADDGDRIVDIILDEIDREPEGVRTRLLAAIKAGDYQVAREPRRVVAYFPNVDKISYEIPLIPFGRDRAN